MYNHIPGHGSLTRKDLTVESVKTYEKKFINKEKCYKKNKFFPESYRLDNKTECEDFFKILNSD